MEIEIEESIEMQPPTINVRQILLIFFILIIGFTCVAIVAGFAFHFFPFSTTNESTITTIQCTTRTTTQRAITTTTTTSTIESVIESTLKPSDESLPTSTEWNSNPIPNN